MPMYDYRCPRCNKSVELRVKDMHETVLCCEEAMVRQFPRANAIYRGLGFYTTENRKIKEFDNGLPKIW